MDLQTTLERGTPPTIIWGQSPICYGYFMGILRVQVGLLPKKPGSLAVASGDQGMGVGQYSIRSPNDEQLSK